MYDNIVIAMEQLHMSYDTIMNLDFYIFENILDHYTKILEDRKKQEDDEMKKQEDKYSPEATMRQQQRYAPQMPKLPTITMPKFK